MKYLRLVLSALVAIALIGCAKGVNHPLVTDKGMEAYKQSLAVALEKMSDVEQGQFNWAVSNFDLDRLNLTYKNKTPIKIIRGEVKVVRDIAPSRIAEIEKELPAWEATKSELSKVTAANVEFKLEQGAFRELSPVITAEVSNQSKFGYSTITWLAELYVDDKPNPVATAEQYDFYKEGGGLAPGATTSRKFTVSTFMSRGAPWDTLEIRNAKTRVVKLTIIQEQSKDFSEKTILPRSQLGVLKQLKSNLAAAEALKSI